ncbi:MAG: hypothetical protein ACLFV8_11190, partial [Alphaproteobacteria bacterium]
MNEPALDPVIESLVPAAGLRKCADVRSAFGRIVRIYNDGLERIKRAFEAYLAGTPAPPGEAVYPYLCVE